MAETREQVVGKILQFFLDNKDIFNATLELLNREIRSEYAWECEGYIDEQDEFHDMDELNEIYKGFHAVDILTEASEWRDESGSSFNPQARYFRMLNDGLVISANEKDYGEYMTEETIDRMAYCISYVDVQRISNRMADLLSEYREAKEEE